MFGLRRAYHRYFGHHHERFLLAALATIIVVAWVGVPWFARLLTGLAAYGPGPYEPKDFARTRWERGITDLASWTAEDYVDLGLFALLAVLWYLSAGGRGRGLPRQ